MEPSFQLRLYGDDSRAQSVRPWSVDVKDLVAFLSNREKAILETALFHNILLPKIEDAAILSLVEITDLSYGLGLRIIEKAAVIMGLISNSLATGHLGDLPPKAINALAAISKQAEKMEWAVQIIPSARSGMIL